VLKIDAYLIILFIGVVLVLLGALGLDLGDILGIETLSLACLLVSFGGIGYVTGNWIISAIVSIVFTAIIHLLVVVPMRNVHSSTSVSQESLVGRRAIVTIPIPARGTGEIVMRMKLAEANHIAESFDKEDIETDAEVVVVEIINDVFFVSKLNLN
jgi:membrane protein implicated in regulation of membrane protease activity